MSVVVTACDKAKEHNGKPIYKVTLSDGRSGESYAKEIPVNTPVSDIEVQESQYGLKFKLIAKNGFAGGGGRPKAGNESFALAYAKDIVVAMIPKMENPKSADLGKVAVTLAETFYTFLESKKK